MKKKILVRAPVLTRSGYGEHSRFLLRSLRAHEDQLDIYVIPINWGQCGWIYNDDEERQWLDKLITKTALAQQQANIQYDVSIQVSIPNEWQRLAPVNIGVTAGIETTKVSPVWLERANMMDKIITISNHSKNVFLDTVYDGVHKETGQKMKLRCDKPIEIVHYPVKEYEEVDLNLNLETDFNFLSVAQWGQRKNIENTIKWFVEEFIDQPVGLVVKAFMKGNSVIDRTYCETAITNLLKNYENRKCKVYLLHGDMTEKEVHSLYKHPKIKALVSLAHGEGFGLSQFEAAYSGLPVIAPEWSGYLDFLCAPKKDGKTGKEKVKPHFACVEYDIQPVQESALWEGVIEADSMWCYPQQGSYKMKLREVHKDYGRFRKQAQALKKWVMEEFNEQKQLALFAQSALGKEFVEVPIEDLPKISIITSVYDGDEFIRPFLEDITKQTAFESNCELILINANSPGNEEETIKEYVKKYPNNIVYQKLDKDPGIYGVWNIGVEMSTGDYLTNANLDDRKAPRSLELHAKELFLDENVDLVYADMLITDKPNETWDANSSNNRAYNFPDFSFDNLKMVNMPHAAPMWRKSLHRSHGLFDQKYRSAGDWEMWLRAASKGSTFKKISGPLGLYYFNPKGISTNPDNFSWKREEESEIYETYKEAKVYETFYV
jgi:glycosyltransferase involved in cell wall biosynthesis